MALQIGDTAPDFEADTTEGRLRVHDWIGLPADTSGDADARTPADNQTVRNVLVIGPDKKLS